MVNFTCPHCGKRAVRDDLDPSEVEYVNLGNGLPDAIFLATPPGLERHIDERLACDECYERAGQRRPIDAVRANPADPPHPYGSRYHREVRLANPVGQRVGE